MSDTIRLFISVPMTGRSEEDIYEQIDAEQDKACRHFAECNINVMLYDSYIDAEQVDDAPYRNKDVYMLSKSIEILSFANAIWMGEGWRRSRGCQVEHMVALEYGISTYYSELED